MSDLVRLYDALEYEDPEAAAGFFERNTSLDLLSIVPGKGKSVLQKLWELDQERGDEVFSDAVLGVDTLSEKKFKQYTKAYDNILKTLLADSSVKVNTSRNAAGAGPSPANAAAGAPGPSRLNALNATHFPELGGVPPTVAPSNTNIAKAREFSRLVTEFLNTLSFKDSDKVLTFLRANPEFNPLTILPEFQTSFWHLLLEREKENINHSLILNFIENFYKLPAYNKVFTFGSSISPTPNAKLLHEPTPKQREIYTALQKIKTEFITKRNSPSEEVLYAKKYFFQLAQNQLKAALATPETFLSVLRKFTPEYLRSKDPLTKGAPLFPILSIVNGLITDEKDDILQKSLEYIIPDQPLSEVCTLKYKAFPNSCDVVLLIEGFYKTVSYLIRTGRASERCINGLAQYLFNKNIPADKVEALVAPLSREQFLQVYPGPTMGTTIPIAASIVTRYSEQIPLLFTKDIFGMTFLDTNSTYSFCPLFLTANNDNEEAFDILLTNLGADINSLDNNKRSLFYYILQYTDIKYAKKLVENGADPNRIGILVPTTIRTTPYLEIARALSRGDDKRAPLLLFLLDLPMFDLDINIQTVKDFLQSLPAGALDRQRVQDAYEVLLKRKRDSVKYRGYTQGQLRELNAIVEKPADFSMCPICLSTAIRSEGCLYMTHNCSTLGIPYHEELYELYKNHRGDITWCTMCSRIGMTRLIEQFVGGHMVLRAAHEHLQLGPASGPKPAPAPLRGADNPFDRDCVTQGGGGVTEKYIRLHRLREVAYDLQREVGKLSEWDAKKELIEDVWDAPLVRNRRAAQIKEEMEHIFATEILPAATARRNAKIAELSAAGGPAPELSILLTPDEDTRLNSVWSKYGKATTNFPERNAKEEANRVASLAKDAALLERAQANIPRPNAANATLQPIRYKADTEANSNANMVKVCSICQLTEKPRWAFQHKEPNGTVQSHTDMPICEDCLTNAITGKLSEKGLPSFGRCWLYPGCKALFWPQEIQGKIPADLYEAYRVEFNKKILEGSLKGGMRGGVRYQVGGVPFLTPIPTGSVSCTAPNGVTPTTCSKCKTRRGGRRKQQKRKRTQKRR